VVSQQIMDELIKRAAAMDATKSEYASLIIKYWFAKGCPPVNEVEQRLLERDGRDGRDGHDGAKASGDRDGDRSLPAK
jgi:hypothetical protein